MAKMVTKVKEVVKEVKEGMEGKALLGAARKVLLAGIGAVALAQDEVEDFVNKLVERGEIAEKDGRKLVQDVMDRRKMQVEKTGDEVSARVQEALDRMNVPTKSDIDALGTKIAALTRKVDQLKKSG
jgi:poly(hydroxyalkanoate) granule-associated protein